MSYVFISLSIFFFFFFLNILVPFSHCAILFTKWLDNKIFLLPIASLSQDIDICLSKLCEINRGTIPILFTGSTCYKIVRR